LGYKLIDGSGNFLPETARSSRHLLLLQNCEVYKVVSKSKRLGKYYANLQENQTRKVDVLVGAFTFDRKLYLELGGFDEDCFMYSDDDLCIRIKRIIIIIILVRLRLFITKVKVLKVNFT
jgi:GT2 family glycosyltransferase